MKLVIIVLNKVECLNQLLVRFAEEGIKGATILDSVGMAHSLEAHDELRFLGSLRLLLDPARTESKTLFVATEEQNVKTISKVMNEVTGGLDKPDTGIIITLNIESIEGIKY